jgi:hypothetical protein
MIQKRKGEEEKRNDFLNLLVDLMDNEQIIEKDCDNDVDNLGASK